ncbi:MAG: NUDIX hydrolase [Treponema sp.]|nr:NUDIX hydrolase [Treponema sp.]
MNQEELLLNLKDKEWPLTTIDHDRLIARAIVVDDEENFYFVRANRDDDFGKATLIETAGGGVESGEDLDTAIRRELNEELGIEVEVLCKIGLVSDYYNLIHRHNINNYFLCKIVYEKCRCTSLGRLVANREVPVLKRAKELLSQTN